MSQPKYTPEQVAEARQLLFVAMMHNPDMREKLADIPEEEVMQIYSETMNKPE